MTVTKALILVAGLGTRRLPITKAVEKCMLPVGNRPAVDYVVEDCLRAGVTDIVFVVGDRCEQVRRYYERDRLLEERLRDLGRPAQAEELAALAEKASFHYVVQPPSGPYGTAVPVWLCADRVDPGEEVLVLTGDDFVRGPGGETEVWRVVAAAASAGVSAGLLVAEVTHGQLHQYGVVRANAAGELLEIVDRPAPGRVPTNLVNASKYLVGRDLVGHVERLLDGPPPDGGEYRLTDAVNSYVAAGGRAVVVQSDGDYFDCGTLAGWLHANRILARP